MKCFFHNVLECHTRTQNSDALRSFTLGGRDRRFSLSMALRLVPFPLELLVCIVKVLHTLWLRRAASCLCFWNIEITMLEAVHHVELTLERMPTPDQGIVWGLGEA